jgi:hypothetical protein
MPGRYENEGNVIFNNTILKDSQMLGHSSNAKSEAHPQRFPDTNQKKLRNSTTAINETLKNLDIHTTNIVFFNYVKKIGR